MLHRMILLALVCCTALLPASAVRAVSFFDGVFDPSDWSITVTGSGTVSSAQLLAGGNPDAYVEATNRPTPTMGTSVLGYHLHSGFVYDPGVSGAIASISWSIDTLNVAFGQAVALAFEQGGSLFEVGAFITTSLGPGWVPHPTATFLPGDFPGGLDPSAAGDPITFGFLTANTFDPVAGDVDNVVGYDNLSIVVQPVSEPRLHGAVVLGLLVAALRRRARD